MRSLPKTSTVMVTGATGCVGSALVAQLLAVGYQVNVLVRSPGLPFHNPNVRVFSGDILDPDVLNKATTGVETVFHLAAKVHFSEQSEAGREEVFRVNVEGTRNLLEACAANSVSRFVFFSTVAVLAGLNERMDENSPCNPKGWYAQSKYEAEKLVLQYQRDQNLFVSILRLPLVYGPRDRGNVARLIEAIRSKRFFVIGSGKNLKTIVYSENAAAAALHVIRYEKADGQTYIVSDAAINLNELSQSIAAHLGVSLPGIHIPKALGMAVGIFCDGIKGLGGPSLPLSRDRVQKLTSHMHCISEKITKELDFHPPVSFQEGLQRSIAWHKTPNKEAEPLSASTVRFHA